MKYNDKFNKIVLIILSCNDLRQIDSCIRLVHNWHLILKDKTEAWKLNLLHELIDIQFKCIALKTF